MHSVLVLVIAIISYAAAQQTFQSTVFDIPAELPPEDYALLSQIDDVPKKEIKQIVKSMKSDKSALHLSQVEPPARPSFAQPQTAPPPSTPVTPVPFTFSTYPTLAPATLPMHFTMAPFSLPLNLTPPPPPFSLPTHPTLSPIILPSHPTLPPFSFPTHTMPPFTATPPSQLPLTGAAQFPHLQQFVVSHSQVIQPPQQRQEVNPLFVQSPENHQQRNAAQQYQLPQSHQPMHQSVLQPHQQLFQQIGNPEQPQPPYGGLLQQPQPMRPQLPELQQFVAQTPPQQQQLHPLHQQYGENQYEQTNHLTQHLQSFGSTRPQIQQFVQPETSQYIRLQSSQQQPHYEQVVASGQTMTLMPQSGSPTQQNAFSIQNSTKHNGQVERVSNSTPNRFSIWFKEDFDTSACDKNLSAIAEKFRAKFPTYLQKGRKDDALADLVEHRLIECDRKSSANHWDRVDGLLAKISLSKSEESECRSGLVQERISCLNLYHYACQFVQPSFAFRLVPARITIEEARQAENGAEKCRKVVRLVKKRLEGHNIISN